MKTVIWSLASLLLFYKPAAADVVSVSTSAPTSLINSGFFNNGSIALYANSATSVFLNTTPVTSTQTFASSGYLLNSSSAPLILQNFHGSLYGEAPNSAAAVNVFVIRSN